jgi:site-specific recombinase XerC
MNDTSIVLKQDSQGRVRVGKERADELIAEYQRSGLTGARFAAQIGVRYRTFWSWLEQRGLTSKRPRSNPKAPPRLVEVTFATGARSLVVELPGGGRATIERPEQAILLAALIKAIATDLRP